MCYITSNLRFQLSSISLQHPFTTDPVFHSAHIRHYGLFLVDFQIQRILYKSGYRLLHSDCSPFGLAAYHRVVGIAHKGKPSAFEFFVQFIEHNITQEWAQQSSLGSSFLARLKQTFVHYTASEILVYKTDHSTVFYRTAENFYEFAMAHSVEEAFKVKVNYINVAFIDYLLRSSQCFMAASSQTEAVACLTELVLINRVY